jgi:hypothetical protein
MQFGFVIFWQKDLGAKAANKMLVKLTPANDGRVKMAEKSLSYRNALA